MKPGPTTSEFWVTMVAMLAAIGAKISGVDMAGEEVAAIWGPPAAYIFSRGLAKYSGK